MVDTFTVVNADQ